MADLEAGSVFGRYRIERLVGRGGFGAVYLAEDTNPHLLRKVALKVLDPELAADANFRDRFLRESLLAIELEQHPSLVPVYDAGEQDGTLYIAMRFIDGTDLASALRAGPIGPERTAAMISQVGGALDVAHAAGVVHRDVKPANILLSNDLKRAYLADFGLTKRVGTESVLTRAGQFLGTLHYASPEQIEGKPVDGRTDQYALGCVMYECLTGHPPFAGELNAMISAHLTKPLPSVRESDQTVPAAIDAVLARATQKNPADRFPTCGEFAAATTRALSPSGDTVGDGGVLTPPPPPSAPASATVVAGTPVPSSPSAPLTPPPPGAPVTPAPGGPLTPPPGGQWTPPPRGPRRSPLPFILAGAGGLAVIAVVVVLVLVLGGGGGGGGSPPTTTTSSGPRLSAAEQALRTHVPVAFRSTCQPANDTKTPGEAASLRCTPPGTGVAFVTYFQFDSAAALNNDYQNVLNNNSIARESGTGQCSAGMPNESSYSSNGVDKGRIVCFIDTRDGTATVWWTDADRRILVLASRTDNDLLALGIFWKNGDASPV
jgi:serine/threonine-protein kinase